MNTQRRLPNGKPFDIHDRLLVFACDIVRTAQFLHSQGPIGRELSYQVLSAGTSTGANAEESDGASSHNDFIAKNRIALKEAKETRFRLRVCRGCDFLDSTYDQLLDESDQLVRILGKIVHNAIRRREAEKEAKARRKRAKKKRSIDD
jgi:four helix bundle protein